MPGFIQTQSASSIRVKLQSESKSNWSVRLVYRAGSTAGAHTHAHTRAHPHARTPTRTHTRTPAHTRARARTHAHSAVSLDEPYNNSRNKRRLSVRGDVYLFRQLADVHLEAVLDIVERAGVTFIRHKCDGQAFRSKPACSSNLHQDTSAADHITQSGSQTTAQ